MLDLTSSLDQERACREALEAKNSSLYIGNTGVNTGSNTVGTYGEQSDNTEKGANAPVVTDQHTPALFPENELPPLETEPEKPPVSPNGQKPTKPERPARPETNKGKGKGNVTNEPPAAKPKTGLDAHTDLEKAFWALWLNADQNKKVPPQYKDSASDHIKAMAAQVTSQEQMDSLTKFARKQLSQQLGREVWRVQLGNLRASFPDWDREQQKQNKPASTSPTTEIKKPEPKQNLILWSKTIEDIPLIEQFKHTRRGRVDEWESLRDQIHWEYVTEEEAMQCGWEEGRVFSDRETRELFAAKERMKELASAS